MNEYDENRDRAQYTYNVPNQTRYQGAYAEERPGGRTALYVSIGAAGLAAAGLVTALVLGLGDADTTRTSGTPPDSTTTHSQVQPASTTPSQEPSSTVRLLQQQLGRLNYYEGPVNGVWNPQVTQAITYLQRDAHLPQTGQLNAATQTALNRMLTTGNNQMAG
jgi:hypothetical protein